jgi:hypothetical protein
MRSEPGLGLSQTGRGAEFGVRIRAHRLLATPNKPKCSGSTPRSGCRSRPTSAVSGSIPRPTRRRRATTLFRAGGCCCSAGFQLRGPSRVAGFSLVGFGAKVASGSSDSTMAISSPGSRSEARAGRR